MTDPQFIENIKLWVSYDNKIEEASKNIKNLRNDKTNLSNQITSYMDKNNIQDTIINISNGQNIKYCEQNVQSPLTYKFLEEVLNKYFHPHTEKVPEIISFIKANRHVKKECFLKRGKNK
jgi:hypothetical protein